jgi:hypothetical protein
VFAIPRRSTTARWLSGPPGERHSCAMLPEERKPARPSRESVAPEQHEQSSLELAALLLAGDSSLAGGPAR